MSERFKCLCPIFLLRPNADRLEQIATCVSINLGSKIFLLTAAHVIDEKQIGDLYIPTAEGIAPIQGRVTCLPLPSSGKRDDDKIDAAYIELDSVLEETIVPLSREDLSLYDFYLEGDLYTFAGFPYRKSKATLSSAGTKLTTYTGEAASEAKYRSLGYSSYHHIVIDFRRKKSVDLHTGKRRIAPLPHGVSGGGIFSWNKDLSAINEETNLRCTGIGHTYLGGITCSLIGIRLGVYLTMISATHPEIMKEAGKEFTPDLSLVALVGYRRDEWDEIMSEAEDSENMQDNWESWRSGIETGIEEMAMKGTLPIIIDVTAAEIREFCDKRNMKNIGFTRANLASMKMAQALLGFDLEEAKLNFPADVPSDWFRD